MKENEMNLIERYIAEVGRHLPEKDRADIEAEIRSMLEDTLEERSQQTGKPVDEKLATEVLEEVGDPRLLASKYTPAKQYLIGPGWYEIYLKTLQRVLWMALPIYATVRFILTLTRDPLDFIGAAGEAAGGAFSVGVQILFWITIVFVFLEHSEAVPNEDLSSSKQKWTAAQLPDLPRTRQIPIVESIIDIATTLFVMIWIVLPAVMNRFQGDTGPLPLHPNLWDFWLPALLVLMGLTLIHELFQLKIGNWTPALMITNVILGLTSIVYIAALVLTQNVINPAFLAMLDSRGASELRDVATWTVNISAAVIAGIYVWDIINSIRLSRQLEQPSRWSVPTHKVSEGRRMK
jgi:hypothetical protein